MLKERVKEGTSKPTQHKHLIEKSDLEKLSTYFKDALNNPIYCVGVFIHNDFLSRGQEFHHQLMNSFTFHTDENGEYVMIGQHKKTTRAVLKM